MNRTEFVKAVAAETGATQKSVKEMLEAIQKVAYAEMAKCEEVSVFDGLKLSGVHKDEHEGRNPQTGETVMIAAKVMPKARFGAVAKRIVNGEE